MAIKRGIVPKLAEVGKIKTGYKGAMVKSKNGKDFQPPKKLDYFIVTTTERSQDGNFVSDKGVMDVVGKAPKELKIRLPFDSVDKNFFTEYQCYIGAKRLCHGDGEKAERRGNLSIDNKGYPNAKGNIDDVKEIGCNPEICPVYLANRCKVSGILSVFLPVCPNVGGVHKYRTHSYNAVASILGALEYFYENTGGILQGLPLKLVMLKKTTAEHGTIAYPTIVIDGEEVKKIGGSDLKGLRMLSVDEKTSREVLGVDMKTIEAEAVKSGFFKDSDTAEDIQGEFYPVEEEAEPTPKPDPKKKGSSAKSVSEKKGSSAKSVSEKKGSSAKSVSEKLKEKDPEPTKQPEKEKDNGPEIF